MVKPGDIYLAARHLDGCYGAIAGVVDNTIIITFPTEYPEIDGEDYNSFIYERQKWLNKACPFKVHEMIRGGARRTFWGRYPVEVRYM